MGEEKPLVERFSQEVRWILLGRNERHTKLESLNRDLFTGQVAKLPKRHDE